MALDGSLITPVTDPEYSCAEATLMLRQIASAASQTLVRVLIVVPCLSELEASGASSEFLRSPMPTIWPPESIAFAPLLGSLECIANANMGSEPSRVVRPSPQADKQRYAAKLHLLLDQKYTRT